MVFLLRSDMFLKSVTYTESSAFFVLTGKGTKTADANTLLLKTHMLTHGYVHSQCPPPCCPVCSHGTQFRPSITSGMTYARPPILTKHMKELKKERNMEMKGIYGFTKRGWLLPINFQNAHFYRGVFILFSCRRRLLFIEEELERERKRKREEEETE